MAQELIGLPEGTISYFTWHFHVFRIKYLIIHICNACASQQKTAAINYCNSRKKQCTKPPLDISRSRSNKQPQKVYIVHATKVNWNPKTPRRKIIISSRRQKKYTTLNDWLIFPRIPHPILRRIINNNKKITIPPQKDVMFLPLQYDKFIDCFLRQ